MNGVALWPQHHSQDEMKLCRRERQRRCFLVALVLLWQEAEDELAHSQEVDDLSDAEERGDDQRPAVGALQEGRRTLVTQDLPEEPITAQR